VGLGIHDGKAVFQRAQNQSALITSRKLKGSSMIEVEIRKVSTLMKELGHESIDLLKLNIEGSEYGVINDIATNNLQVKQICVEFHHALEDYQLRDTIETIGTLRKMGFKFFGRNYNAFSFIRNNNFPP
jgi:hypothetical protein